jgi:xanthine dehydrogenase accessory factor
MIGSRHKRDTIYSALRTEGADPDRIERVHCPIGAAIGAETPEEIAVSIVAEMIMQRSQKKR